MKHQDAALAFLPYITSENPSELTSDDIWELIYQECLDEDDRRLLAGYAMELERKEELTGATEDLTKPYGYKVAAILGHAVSFLEPDVLLRCVSAPRFSERERKIVAAYAAACA